MEFVVSGIVILGVAGAVRRRKLQNMPVVRWIVIFVAAFFNCLMQSTIQSAVAIGIAALSGIVFREADRFVVSWEIGVIRRHHV